MEEADPGEVWIGGSTEFNAANIRALVRARPVASDGTSASDCSTMCSTLRPTRTVELAHLNGRDLTKRLQRSIGRGREILRFTESLLVKPGRNANTKVLT